MANSDHIEALEQSLAGMSPEMREAFGHVIAVLKSLDGQGSEVPTVQAAAVSLPASEESPGGVPNG